MNNTTWNVFETGESVLIKQSVAKQTFNTEYKASFVFDTFLGLKIFLRTIKESQKT